MTSSDNSEFPRRAFLKTSAVLVCGALCSRLVSHCNPLVDPAKIYEVQVDEQGNPMVSEPEIPELFQPGHAVIIKAPQVEHLLIVHDQTGVFNVYSARCTHAGCPLGYRATQDVIECPCHGAQFAKTGEPTRGPAQIALMRYDAVVSIDSQGVSILRVSMPI